MSKTSTAANYIKINSGIRFALLVSDKFHVFGVLIAEFLNKMSIVNSNYSFCDLNITIKGRREVARDSERAKEREKVRRQYLVVIENLNSSNSYFR